MKKNKKAYEFPDATDEQRGFDPRAHGDRPRGHHPHGMHGHGHHGCGGHGPHERGGRGEHGAHPRARWAERMERMQDAYERGFVAGFARGQESVSAVSPSEV